MNFSKIHQIVSCPKLILLRTNSTKICQNCQFRQADSLWEFDQNSSKFWILPSWFCFDRFWLKFAKIVRSMDIHSVWRNLSNLSFSLLHAFLDISELTCQDLCLKIGLLLNRQGTMLWMQPLERVLCTNCLGKDHVIIKEKLA